MSGRRILVVAATEGELQGVPDHVERLVCGVGPVDAGAHTAARLARGDVDVLLHVGIAGVREGSGFAIGDVIVGTSSLYCDTRSTFVVQHEAPSAGLVAAIQHGVPSAIPTTIGTSAEVAGTGGRSDVAVEAMEGFAVLRAASLADVLAVEVRVISNEVDEPDRGKWQFDRALGILADITPQLVDAIRSDHPTPTV